LVHWLLIGGLLQLVQREGPGWDTPPINGQCTNFILFDYAKGLKIAQAYQQTLARRVRPAFESQTRLTRTVAENRLEMADY